MPRSKQTNNNSRAGGQALAKAVTSVLKGALNIQQAPRKTKAQARRSKAKVNRAQSSYLQSNANRSMPSATGIGRLPVSMPLMSDLVDFVISYNAADIVLGGATTTTAPGSLGIAYWYPRGPSATGRILTNGLLPIAPADPIIGRSYVTDLMKHYSRRVYTKIKVFCTPELTNTGLNGLFAIAAARGGNDTDNCASSAANSLATFSDTDIMTMKDATPFRVYDSIEYDASWAIAGGSGPLQNEFAVGNMTGNASTVVDQLVDGDGLVPCCLFMGGSSTAFSSGSNVVSHRVIIQMTLHLLDYRGNVQTFTPNLEDKPNSTYKLSPHELVEAKSLNCPTPHIINNSREELIKQMEQIRSQLENNKPFINTS